MKENEEIQDGPYVYEKPLKSQKSKAGKTSIFAANVVSVGAVLMASQVFLPAHADGLPESTPSTDNTSASAASENQTASVADPSSSPTSSPSGSPSGSPSTAGSTYSEKPASIKQVIASPELGKIGTFELPADWSNTTAPTSAASAGEPGTGSTGGNTSSATGSSSGGSSASSGSSGSGSGNTSSATGSSSGGSSASSGSSGSGSGNTSSATGSSSGSDEDDDEHEDDDDHEDDHEDDD